MSFPGAFFCRRTRGFFEQIFEPNAQVFPSFSHQMRKFFDKTFENVLKHSKTFENIRKYSTFLYPPAQIVRSGEFAVLSFEF